MNDASRAGGGAAPADPFLGALDAFRRGDLEGAEQACVRIVRAEPRHFHAWHLRGVIAIQRGAPQAALEPLAQALLLDPTSAIAECNRGNALLLCGRAEEAIASFDAALEREPNFADAYYNRGNALFDLARLEAAGVSFARAAECRPDHWRAHDNLGVTYLRQGRPESALAHFERSIAIEPNNPEALAHRGHALRELRQAASAIASYEASIALAPAHAEAWNGRGTVLAVLHEPTAALACFDRAIAARPAFAEAHLNRGNVLADLGCSAEALASYDAALQHSPELAEAHYKRGDLLRRLGSLELALDAYDRAFALAPELNFLEGMRLHARMQVCNWSEFNADVAHLAAGIERGAPVCPPFALAALCDSAALQRQAAEIFVAVECPATPTLPPPSRRAARQRLRVGYFSADFGPHPVSYLTAGLFETHDRSKFEVMGLSLGPAVNDPLRRRLERAFDRFLDVASLSDRAIAELGRDLDLDIAVDLGGYTDGARPRIFALRAAPLQISYIGFLGTLGALYYDYLIADRTLIPAANRAQYAEHLLYLPSYQVNDPQRPKAEARFVRADLGLPAAGFVYCSCNATYKITPRVFVTWMRILARVPGSVLLLNVSVEAARRNLEREARNAGVDPARLIFAAPLPYAEYLARYRCADLFLDTAPYNAGTTASDALWAGLPVLTCPGEAFASRMAASVLTAAGLTDLIAPTPEAYEVLAVALALEPARLSALRERCERLRDGARLFDLQDFTACLERGYRQMHDLQAAGEPLRDIVV